MTKTKISQGIFGKPTVLTDKAQNFLAAIIASSDDAIVSKDLNGVVTTWNEGARRIFGYEAEEILGESILRLIPPELRYEEDFILAKIRAGERIEHFETTRMRKNGERFPISVSISPIQDDDGVVIGASKIARDISDRKRAEESRFRLAAIVDSADDAIISKTLDGTVTSWNNGARQIFGYKAEEMIGRSILRLIPRELYHEEDEILRKLRAGQKIEHYETVRLTKAGDARDVSVSISPILDDTGKVIGASKIARDISDKKKIEQMMMQAEKIATTGRMAAAFAHEVNNPLSSVLNLVFLARQDDASREEVQNYLATAEHELERVSYIARRSLGFYRDTALPTEVQLRDLIDVVLDVYRTRIRSSDIVVTMEYVESKKLPVYSGEIIQVFSNLVSNAIDAMPQGGRLSISITEMVSRGRGCVRVMVKDSGPGIPDEHLEKIFEPFFTTKGNLGTGIGLWVAKRLVERHKGQISISSKTGAEDSGTVVTIDLPFDGLEDEVAEVNGFGVAAGTADKSSFERVAEVFNSGS